MGKYTVITIQEIHKRMDIVDGRIHWTTYTEPLELTYSGVDKKEAMRKFRKEVGYAIPYKGEPIAQEFETKSFFDRLVHFLTVTLWAGKK